MNIGDLVYSGHMMEIGHMVLGIVTETHRSSSLGAERMYFVFWVDGSEPMWYYSNEVERVDATRRSD